MRSFRRPAIRPPTFLPSGKGGREAATHRRDYVERGLRPSSFPEHWKAADVRGALLAMQGKVCAYCGCLLPRNDLGDVEHFRPKKRVEGSSQHGGYWWLAYEFANCFLSCRACNQSRKRDRFPILGAESTDRRTSFERRAELASEPRALWDPGLDDVDEWLRVDLDDPLLALVPSDGLEPLQCQRVERTVEFFRLNKDPERIFERRAVHDATLDALERGRERQATRLACRHVPSSVVARDILRARAPTLLPDLETELEELLASLLEWIDLYLQIDQPDQAERRRFEEHLWCLAVFVADPFLDPTMAVRRACETAGLGERVGALAGRFEPS